MVREVLPPLVPMLPACPHCGHRLSHDDYAPFRTGFQIGYATSGLDKEGNLIGGSCDPTKEPV